MHDAVMKGDSTAVEMLLSNSEELPDLNLIDKEGYSALGLALREE